MLLSIVHIYYIVDYSLFCFREEKFLSEQLKRQMLEVKAKEEESAILEHQQAVVMREQYQLYKAVSVSYRIY